MSESAYARAGVDIEAGDRAVELMKAHVKSTNRVEVMGGLGGFAGLFDASAFKNFRHPVLATSTDGVGTKVAIAQALGVYNTVGWDLVGMLVDDLVVCGAEPLFLTDYIACGKVVPERIASIVEGIAVACASAGTALIGGETAEHPGLMEPDEFDMAGATVGVVEADEILGAHRVRVGDVAVAMEASGLHSNGYSLVRRVFADAGMGLETHVDEFAQSLGEELLTPTRVYAADALALIRGAQTHAMSHITGGGLANNLARVIPDEVTVRIDRSTWAPAAVYQLVQDLGRISRPDIEATLNMGVGMVAMVAPEDATAAVELLTSRGVPSWICGEAVAPSDQRVELVGAHRG